MQAELQPCISVGEIWSVVDNQEMSLPPSHDSREDNPVLRLLKENLDEISGDDADLKKESSSGKKLC